MISAKARNSGILSLVITIGVLGGLLWRNSHISQEPTEPTVVGSTEKSSTATTKAEISPSFSQAYLAYAPVHRSRTRQRIRLG